jgi:3-isopropylmalate/(R)-2-methylmalate dehydratase small subunit
VVVDLENRSVSAGDLTESFDVDPFVRECFLNGWDGVGLTLRHEDDIAADERKRPAWRPAATV